CANISSETPIMLGGDFPKRRARCTTARSSTARSTARPHLTRPRSCMRKESSFTRCPCCRTSGTDQHLVLANASLALFRCSNYPTDIPPQEWHERGHALTVAFQPKAGEEGFQIYVAPIIGMLQRSFALQLRALCSDHPVDGPSFDQVALRVALSFGRVVAEDEPAGQLGRRTQHSLVMLDDGI